MKFEYRAYVSQFPGTFDGENAELELIANALLPQP
jgi:hypothetical protein